MGFLHAATLSALSTLAALALPQPEAARSNIASWARLRRGVASAGPESCVSATRQRVGPFVCESFSSVGTNSQAMKAVRGRRVLVNGALADHRAIVNEHDNVTLMPALSDAWTDAEASFAIGIVRSQQAWVVVDEDEYAIVNKPAGVHTKPFGAHKSLEAALPALLSPPPDELAREALLWPVAVHRLDARVAGLVVCAKTRRAAAALAEEFRERRVSKRYRAIALGEVGSTGDTLDVTADVDGRAAHTRVRVVEVTPHVQAGCITTLDLYPSTGRRHQLRRHCAQTLGHPLLGDDLYAQDRDAGGDTAVIQHGFIGKRSAGLFLQSCEVSFEFGGQRVHAHVPEARKFARQRERARRGWQYQTQTATERES